MTNGQDVHCAFYGIITILAWKAWAKLKSSGFREMILNISRKIPLLMNTYTEWINYIGNHCHNYLYYCCCYYWRKIWLILEIVQTVFFS